MQLLDVARGRGTAFVLALALAVTTWRAVSVEHPHRGRVVVTDTETTILDQVEFVPGTSTICVRSRPILDAVAATLAGNPSIELVEVQSHTSGLGNADANQVLSEQRAAAVVTYLVNAGIDSSRLVAQGYGDTQPLERGAPGTNERVSFLILRRSPDPGS